MTFDLNRQDTEGKTLLHYLVTIHNSSHALRLIKDGADVNAKDFQGNTPLHEWCDRFQEYNLGPNVGRALIVAGANVNAQNSRGDTPLHRAVLTPHLELVDFLIQHKADPNLRDMDGETPLHFAPHSLQPMKVKLEMVERLLILGANPAIQDIQGRLPGSEYKNIQTFIQKWQKKQLEAQTPKNLPKQSTPDRL